MIISCAQARWIYLLEFNQLHYLLCPWNTAVLDKKLAAYERHTLYVVYAVVI